MEWMRRIWVGLLMLIGWVLIVPGGVFAEEGDVKDSSGAKPNVVVILIDTLRADRIHAERNGRAVMPNLAAFAGTCTEFTHAVAACSWTRPSMASLFTGVYVDVHQIAYTFKKVDLKNPNSDFLSKEWLTLPEYLAGNGYDNYAFVTNANLSMPVGFGQGFAPDRYVFANNARAEEVTDRSLKAISALKPPFFAYLHYMDPHVPYDPPKAVLGELGDLPAIAPEDKNIFNSFYTFFLKKSFRANKKVKETDIQRLSEAGRERVRMLYDLECFYADRHVGRLINELLGKYPETIFIVTSDHGEEFWRRGGMGHGSTLYEEQIAVPLLVHKPGAVAQKVTRTTETMGLLPTLSTLLGFPSLEHWQGPNWFAPEHMGDRPSFARTYGLFESHGIDVEAVWKGGMKMIRDNGMSKTEVYNLEDDPLEQNDLSAVNIEWMQLGMELLDTHRASNTRLREAGIAPVEAQLDPVMLDQLKVLGYLGD
jgi:arylsulfatase A-like enzyme